MTYNITYNPQFNSHEIYFDGKPSEAVRAALKELKFRWHSVKRCWYGYGSSEESLAAAITGTTTEEEPAEFIFSVLRGSQRVIAPFQILCYTLKKQREAKYGW